MTGHSGGNYFLFYLKNISLKHITTEVTVLNWFSENSKEFSSAEQIPQMLKSVK